jgi:hypothetical protein
MRLALPARGNADFFTSLRKSGYSCEIQCLWKVMIGLSKSAFIAFSSLAAIVAADAKPEIMPLADVVPGMRGEWRTVVSGTKIESFELEILGISQHFVGPQRAVIIGQALDPKNRLTGPVAGMSGSPVFIDGKLVGAYAHGYTWPKDQAIIGITPIEQMLEVLESYPVTSDDGDFADMAVPSPVAGRMPVARLTGAGTGVDALRIPSAVSGDSMGRVASLLEPVPTPLVASGISKRVLEVFEGEFEALGLDVMAAPSGATNENLELPLEPGSPVAAVLMSGDFNFAATGTVTYRDGDTLLAFGHPFFQMGASRFPMAGAEIITIVQSMSTSFKLSNTGPLVGAIYQDRLTAVAGKLGQLPPMTEVLIKTSVPGGARRSFSGKMVEHPKLSPLMAAIALLQSLESTMESTEEQTFYLDGRIEIENFAAIQFRDVASGPAGAVDVALEFFEQYQKIVANPYAVPRVTGVYFDIDMRDERLVSSLKAVHVENKRVRPGGAIDLSFALYNFQAEPTRHRISVPVPKGLKSGQELTVIVADAREAERIEGAGNSVVTSLEGILDQLRNSKTRQAIYIKLLKKSPGLRLEGEHMPGLPPSVLALYTSPGNNVVRQPVEETTLWETEVLVPGEFRGTYRVPITLE